MPQSISMRYAPMPYNPDHHTRIIGDIRVPVKIFMRIWRKDSCRSMKKSCSLLVNPGINQARKTRFAARALLEIASLPRWNPVNSGPHSGLAAKCL
jgi:hypothetical protein